MMKSVLAAFIIGCLLISCSADVSNKNNDEVRVQQLADHIKKHGQDPVQYVLSKFDDHDVVIIGESHYIKDDPIFVQKLIPVLHANGINILATEHARAEDQYLADSLLTGEEYDELLARKITFLGFVHWPFREYVDIYRAAWESNQSRESGTPAFRILGVHCSDDWSVLKKPEDSQNDSLMKLVRKGCGERDWANIVLDAVANGEKVLAFCGIHHGFTRYSQPVVNDGQFVGFARDRFGNYVYDELGDRAMTVYLHAPFLGPKGYDDDHAQPADGYIDRAMRDLGPEQYPVGFDVSGSPLAEITLANCVYKHGYDPFTLDEFCDGYIFTRPFEEFETVTVIDDFVTEENLEYALNQTPGPQYRTFDVKSYHEEFHSDVRGIQESWRKLSLDSL